MATSGAFETNSVAGVYPSPNRMRFAWSLSSQNENDNSSVINWNIRGWGGASSGYWVQNYNAITIVNGSTVQNKGSFQMYHNSVFGSGSRTIDHNSSGAKTFSASASGRIYYNTVNSTGNNSWSLPSLYQEIAFSSVSFPNITDVGFQVKCTVNRTADRLELSINGAGYVTYHSGNFTTVTVDVGGASNPMKSGYPHTVKLRVRRDSNGNLTESGTYTVDTLGQNNFFDIDEF